MTFVLSLDMKYYEMSQPELLSLLLNDEMNLAERDEIMYHILSERLAVDLRRKFEPYKEKMIESLEDVIQDYFLYLRGEDDEPYRILRSIRNASSLEVWLVTTFRNFASNMASSEWRHTKVPYKPVTNKNFSDPKAVPEEDIISLLSTLVAYCFQEFKLTYRFIFLRMLLTFLHKERTLPEKEIAEAMGITDVYYRVSAYRVRRRVHEFRNRLLSGEELALTPESRCMAEDLNENFLNWYQKISHYYDATLESLPQSQTIISLRLSHYSKTTGLLYDREPAPYGRGLIEARALWNSFDL